MTEAEFEARHAVEWEALARAIEPPKPKKEHQPGGLPAHEVPRHFRNLVAHLALARDRQYRTSLIDRLHAQVLAAHLAVHGARAEGRGGALSRFRDFAVAGFPSEARRQWRYLMVAAVAFFGPFLGGIAVLQFYPDFVHYLVSPEELARIQTMYAPGAKRFGAARDADTDMMMFGYYIANNVRIDFQAVAGGIFFGLGTLAALLFNGIFLGAIAGHLTQVGYGENFWGFVSGHSAPELLGLVYAGAAGLMIGHALVAPGRHTRAEALRLKGPSAAAMLYGAASMTVVAAFIEAFWSSRVGIPFAIKVGFGTLLAVIFFAYLAFAGRNRAA
jgi:uncharacterized membrane protein SpoIIM required for sporulation